MRAALRGDFERMRRRQEGEVVAATESAAPPPPVIRIETGRVPRTWPPARGSIGCSAAPDDAPVASDGSRRRQSGRGCAVDRGMKPGRLTKTSVPSATRPLRMYGAASPRASAIAPTEDRARASRRRPRGVHEAERQRLRDLRLLATIRDQGCARREDQGGRDRRDDDERRRLRYGVSRTANARPVIPIRRSPARTGTSRPAPVAEAADQRGEDDLAQRSDDERGGDRDRAPAGVVEREWHEEIDDAEEERRDEHEPERPRRSRRSCRMRRSASGGCASGCARRRTRPRTARRGPSVPRSPTNVALSEVQLGDRTDRRADDEAEHGDAEHRADEPCRAARAALRGSARRARRTT